MVDFGRNLDILEWILNMLKLYIYIMEVPGRDQFGAPSAAYTAYGNSGPLMHWARPGI